MLRLSHRHHKWRHLLIQAVAMVYCLTCLPLFADNAVPPQAKDLTKQLNKGTFLIATKNLNGSSFEKTVLLLTSYSKQGTMGIAINRPTTLTLQEAFPNDKQFHQNQDILYLGGPVRPDSIFVLLKTAHPESNMQQIADDVYFSPGISAMSQHLEKKSDKSKARAYAGYTGWAAGQLEAEIRRGDWTVIKSDMQIIFSDSDSMWQKLRRAWSGTWI